MLEYIVVYFREEAWKKQVSKLGLIMELGALNLFAGLKNGGWRAKALKSEQKCYHVNLEVQVVMFPSYIIKTIIINHIKISNKGSHDVFVNEFANHMIYIP